MSACMKLDRCWAVLLDPAMTSAVAERVGQGLLRSASFARFPPAAEGRSLR